tara:strand:- start:1745 stop:1945 length:201 start_codon:yes stop_codon:yes gene_type:complete
MGKKKSSRRNSSGKYKIIACQNSNLETSKYAKFAPIDGPCDEKVNVPEEVERTLCYRCTSRSATGK